MRKIHLKAKYILFLLAISALCLALVLHLNQNIAAATETELGETGVSDTYTVGDTLKLSAAEIKSGDFIKSVKPIIHMPDGSALLKDELVLDMAGRYSLEYRAENDGVIYRAYKEFTVNYKIASVTGEFDSLSYGKSDYLAEEEGLLAGLTYGNSLKFNKIISLNDKGADDTLIRLHILPTIQGVADVTVCYIRLTDVNDTSNYVEIMVKQGPSHSTNNPHIVVYMKAGYAGQSLKGWNGPKNTLYTETVASQSYYGYASYRSFSGGYYPGGDYVGKNNVTNTDLAFGIDALKGTVHYLNPTSASNVIIDLKNDYDTPWKGFSTGEVFMSLYADKYVSTNMRAQAGFLITQVYDEDLSADSFSVENAPGATVDFGDYSASNYPMALVGNPYPVFNAAAWTTYGLERLETKVYYGYFDSSYRTQVSINNGAFIPVRAGHYTIEYSVYDRFGNVNSKLVHVQAVKDVNILNISQPVVEANYKEGNAGEKIPLLSELNYTGGFGKVTLSVSAEKGGKSYDTGEGYFIADSAGSYTVTYTLTDYVQQVKSFSYEVNVEYGEEAVILLSDYNFPNYLIKGTYNILPAVTAADYSVDGKYKEINTVLYGSQGDGQSLAESNKYKPESEGIATLTYKAMSAAGKESFEQIQIPVVDVGFGGTLDMSKYFIGQGVTASETSSSLLLTANADGAKTEFIRELMAQSFIMTFNIDGEENNASALNIYLTDTADSSKSVLITLKKTGSSVSLIVNNGRSILLPSTLSFGGRQTDFIVELSDKLLLISNYIVPLSEYQSGESFAGFPSGAVNLTIEFKYAQGTSGATTLIMKNINGQPLNSTGRDAIAPRVHVFSRSYGQFLPGDRVKVSAAKAYDVLDTNTSLTVSVSMGGQYVTSEDGVLLKDADPSRDYYIIVSNIGNYIVEYYRKDTSNLSERPVLVAITVADVQPPVVTLESYTTEAKLGSTVKIPGYTVTDNHTAVKDIKVYVFTKNPYGVLNEVKTGDFKADIKGTYIVKVMAVDGAKNLGIAEFTVKVN